MIYQRILVACQEMAMYHPGAFPCCTVCSKERGTFCMETKVELLLHYFGLDCPVWSRVDEGMMLSYYTGSLKKTSVVSSLPMKNADDVWGITFVIMLLHEL